MPKLFKRILGLMLALLLLMSPAMAFAEEDAPATERTAAPADSGGAKEEQPAPTEAPKTEPTAGPTEEPPKAEETREPAQEVTKAPEQGETTDAPAQEEPETEKPEGTAPATEAPATEPPSEEAPVVTAKPTPKITPRPPAMRDTTSMKEWTKKAWKVTLTGDPRADLLAVALSQLGYTESEKDYSKDKEGVYHGYTVYGDWYGATYSEWCVMFVSFCAQYAGFDESLFPHDANCAKFIKKIEGRGAYMDAKAGYTPQPGDLVFFDLDEFAGVDHVGIVESVDGDMVTTVDGNVSGMVDRRTRPLTGKQIVGFVDVDALMAYVTPEPIEVINEQLTSIASEQ